MSRAMKRRWFALGGGTVALACAVLAFAPLVRGRVSAFATRKHLVVAVGSVLPNVGGVRLKNVSVSAEDLPGMSATFDRVDVDFSFSLHPTAVRVHGGTITLAGSPDELRERVQRARDRIEASSVDAGNSTAGASKRALSAQGIKLVWTSGALALDATGIDAERTDTGTTVRVGSFALTAPEGSAAGSDVRVLLGTANQLAELTAASLTLVATAKQSLTGAATEASADPDEEAPSAAAAASNLGTKPGALTINAASAGAASEGPLFALPNLPALRTQLQRGATLAAERLPAGAHVDITKFSVALTGADGLTLGPGRAYLGHVADKVTASFKSESAPPAPPLELELSIPLSPQADATIALDGGPVAATLLGLKNGKAGVLDAELATTAGKAKLILAGDGSALTFDVNVHLNGIGLQAPRLSAEAIHGLTVGVSARGNLSANDGALRLDNFDFSIGDAHVVGSGGFEQHGANVRARATFAVPTTSCDGMLKSLPTALLPTLRGSTLQGTFGMRGSLVLDSSHLDDLQLRYLFDDRCKFSAVPEQLAQTRFSKPFTHTIYKPDGARESRLIGPGSEHWRSLEHISPFMQAAVLTTEDGTFRRHHGFNHEAVRRALISNLKARRFAQGASTISMQLSKNLFLSREKTLARKLEEVVLTSYLEQIFDKNELLELYLNIVELGPEVYGVNQAAHYYFGREADELNLAECMFLATLLPAPVRLAHVRERGEVSAGQLKTLQTLMKIAEKNGNISATELEEGQRQSVRFFASGGPRPAPRAQPRGTKRDGDDADYSVPDEPAWAPIEPR
jgi:Transglycosylase